MPALSDQGQIAIDAQAMNAAPNSAANANSNTNHFGGLLNLTVTIVAVLVMAWCAYSTGKTEGHYDSLNDKIAALNTRLDDQRALHDRDMRDVTNNTTAAMLVRNDVTILRNDLVQRGASVKAVFAHLPDHTKETTK